ncbi:hypothetical protein NBRC116188_21320 [Oceaniserpentilla sp. 4NH20-0058]|uniref:DUF1003 domain-containing protein n=1 Tax=Oceaniserpentilla sp. 4NH20-0058 TaxID=3127660 RepID=UPI00310C2219
MKKYFENLAKAVFGQTFQQLGGIEQKVIESIANKEPLPENINTTFHEKLSFGQKMADKVASFGGSWTFIGLFGLLMLSWMSANSWFLLAENAFDPYPFILLNLALSALAALQAPIIMMSQNRQAAKDRLEITANYEVSLKSDIEITRLHQKIDDLTALIKQANL